MVDGLLGNAFFNTRRMLINYKKEMFYFLDRR